MNKFASSYYPPRARWYSPFIYAWYALRRRTWLDRLQLPIGISPCDFLLAVLIPGFAFQVRGHKLVARLIYLGELFLAAIFIVWLGYPVANMAFGLLLGTHVSSVLFLLNPWIANARLGFRILFSFLVFVAIGGCIYS